MPVYVYSMLTVGLLDKVDESLNRLLSEMQDPNSKELKGFAPKIIDIKMSEHPVPQGEDQGSRQGYTHLIIYEATAQIPRSVLIAIAPH